MCVSRYISIYTIDRENIYHGRGRSKGGKRACECYNNNYTNDMHATCVTTTLPVETEARGKRTNVEKQRRKKISTR
jgi:hypothetical protein